MKKALLTALGYFVVTSAGLVPRRHEKRILKKTGSFDPAFFDNLAYFALKIYGG